MKVFGGRTSRFEVYGLFVAGIIIFSATVGGAVVLTSSSGDPESIEQQSEKAIEKGSPAPEVGSTVVDPTNEAAPQGIRPNETTSDSSPPPTMMGTSPPTTGDPRCGPWSSYSVAECQAQIDDSAARLAAGRAQYERMKAAVDQCQTEKDRLNGEIFRTQQMRDAAISGDTVEYARLSALYESLLAQWSAKLAECQALPIPNNRIQ